ncbi:uncharacterized protein LOC134539907 [Bacillus rossius redtenbacheri]|uniref:uncharacterized protein LOC134539907 n=1 Tax=Bacillus rossius redtenbacheri TaxID=93214 RepID=UPI002FDE5B64
MIRQVLTLRWLDAREKSSQLGRWLLLALTTLDVAVVAVLAALSVYRLWLWLLGRRQVPADTKVTKEEHQAVIVAPVAPGVYSAFSAGTQLFAESMPEDGDSLFMALARQLYGSLPGGDQHRQQATRLRIKAVTQLAEQRRDYWQLLLDAVASHGPRYAALRRDQAKVNAYLTDLATQGFPAGAESVSALADSVGVNILVYTHDLDYYYVPSTQKKVALEAVILERLRGAHGTHYDSVLLVIPFEEDEDEVGAVEKEAQSRPGSAGEGARHNVRLVRTLDELLEVERMPADGNSLFAALAHQLLGRPLSSAELGRHAARLRQDVVSYLTAHCDDYWDQLVEAADARDDRYADQPTDEAKVQLFLADLAHAGFAACGLALAAVADMLGVDVRVHVEGLQDFLVPSVDHRASKELAVVLRWRASGLDPPFGHFDSVTGVA